MLTVVTMGIVSTFIVLFFPAQQRKHSEESTAVAANAVADVTAYSLAKTMRARNLADLDDILRAAMMHHEVAYAYVLDSRGLMVAMHRRKSAQYDAASESRERAGFSESGDLFRARRSLIGENGSDLIGTLYIGYTLERLDATTRTGKMVASLVGVLVFLFGIAAAYTISHFITEPLGRLARAAERLSDGDYSARVKVSSRDEIGRMAETFNSVADSLQAALLQPTEVEIPPNEIVEHEVQRSPANRHVADAVRVSESRFRSAADYTSESILLIDREGVVRFVSPPLRRLLGYEASELQGAELGALVHPQDRRGLRAALENLRMGVPIELVVRSRQRGGAWKRISLQTRHGRPAQDVDGFVLAVRDADNDTRLLRAVAEKLRLQAGRRKAN